MIVKLSPGSKAYEFACYDASCRPPQSGGTGGSRGGTYGQRGGRPLTGRFGHMSDSQLARSSNPAHKAELEARKKANTNVFLSANVEEFFNHHHARSTGRFASGTGGGLFSIAKTSKKTPKLFKTRRSTSSFLHRESRISPTMRNRRGMIFGAHTEEFFNKNHSKTDGKFVSGSGGGAYAQLVRVHGARVAQNLVNAIGKPVPGIKPTVARAVKAGRGMGNAQGTMGRARYVRSDGTPVSKDYPGAKLVN